MLTARRIRSLFEQLNEGLRREGEIGEIGIIGGAVMCLVYHAREATRDVDAVFAPASVIRTLAERIARDEGLPPDWLNDAAKGFVQGDFERETVLSLSNLRVWAPDARYMLAMKCISARWDTSDRDDVAFLIERLDLQKAEDIFDADRAVLSRKPGSSEDAVFHRRAVRAPRVRVVTWPHCEGRGSLFYRADYPCRCYSRTNPLESGARR